MRGGRDRKGETIPTNWTKWSKFHFNLPVQIDILSEITDTPSTSIPTHKKIVLYDLVVFLKSATHVTECIPPPHQVHQENRSHSSQLPGGNGKSNVSQNGCWQHGALVRLGASQASIVFGPQVYSCRKPGLMAHTAQQEMSRNLPSFPPTPPETVPPEFFEGGMALVQMVCLISLSVFRLMKRRN